MNGRVYDPLLGRFLSADPNIDGVRVGQYSADVVRLVIDLKQGVRPQMFTLAPVAAYQHRLVLDLYPLRNIDPLDALVAQIAQPKPASGASAPAATDASPTPASDNATNASQVSPGSSSGQPPSGAANPCELIPSTQGF